MTTFDSPRVDSFCYECGSERGTYGCPHSQTGTQYPQNPGLATVSELQTGTQYPQNPSIADIADINTKAWGAITPLEGDVEFPLESLYGPLGAMALAISKSLEQPLDYSFMAGLSAISGATFGNAVIQVRGDHREPLAIYTMPAMPSGTRKTEASRRINAPISDWQRERVQDWKREGGQHRIDMAEQALKQAKDQARNMDMDEGIAAIQEAESNLEKARGNRPRLLLAADDSTSEALTVFLANNGGSALITSSEGGFIGNLSGRYSQGQSANLDLVLKAHSHEPYQSDRVGRDSIYIDRPHLGICIGAQPHVLEEMRKSDAMRERGFMQRFLVVLPDHGLGTRTGDGPDMPADVSSEWESRLRAALNFYAYQVEPRVLAFTDEASQAFQTEWRNIEKELGPGGQLATHPGLLSWGAKLPGQLARIAGAFAVLDDPRTTTVGLHHWNAAQNLTGYLTAHARKAWVSARLDPAARVLDWLLEHKPWLDSGTFTTRQVFDSIRRQKWVLDVEDVKDALHGLEDHNYIRVSAIPAKPGRPSEAWEPHPSLLNPDDRPDDYVPF